MNAQPSTILLTTTDKDGRVIGSHDDKYRDLLTLHALVATLNETMSEGQFAALCASVDRRMGQRFWRSADST